MIGSEKAKRPTAGRIEIAVIIATYALALVGGLAVFASLVE